MLPYDINMIRIVLPLLPGKRIGNCKALRRNGCVIRLDDGGSGRSSCLEQVKVRLANLQEIDAGLHLTGWTMYIIDLSFFHCHGNLLTATLL
jgi:hypothetical protein